MWKIFSAPYREIGAAEDLHAARDSSLDPGVDDSSLLPGDGRVMMQCGVAEPPSNPLSCRVTLIVFSVLEEEKARRRIISWPRAANAAQRRLLQLLKARHVTVPFADARTATTRVAFAFFAIADFVKYFQQFAILESVRHLYAFILDDVMLQLTTVPTGAVGPPLFAEVLTRAVCAKAVRMANAQDSVLFDTMIDNVRFVSNDEGKLKAVWQLFLDICLDIGITVGETSPPAAHEYVFLGCRYHPQRHASVGDKILRKLSLAKQMVESGHAVPLVDLQSAFGVCVFAAYALHMPLAPQYFIIKFMRRVIRRDAAAAAVWPCIRKPWLEWIAALVERRFYPAQQDTTATVVIAYSDASPKGWGGVFFVFGKTFIIGAPWSRRVAEGQHINVMELMAARNTLRHISAMLHGVVTFVVDLYVDNTTAKSWLSKQRSRTHVANDILLELSSNDGFRCLRSVSWISSSENVADYASRNFEE
jgi:hypothetical protein